MLVPKILDLFAQVQFQKKKLEYEIFIHVNMCKGPLTDVKASSRWTVYSAVHHVALYTVETDVLST